MNRVTSFFLATFFVSVLGSGASCPKASICFAIDESGSIKPATFKQITSIVTSFAQDYSAKAPGSTFTAVGFESFASVVAPATTNVAQFITDVKKNNQGGGATSIAAGLQLCSQLLNTQPSPRTIVLISDGVDNIGSVQQAAQNIKAAGTALATVAVGVNPDTNLLGNTASIPELSLTFNPTGEFYLPFFTSKAIEKLCKALPIPPFPPVSDACERAFEKCDFTFLNRDYLSTFDASGPPDVSFTLPITAKERLNKTVGVINSNFVPQFIDSKGVAKDITQFGSPRFTPTHFKTFKLGMQSGIGHQTYHGRQVFEVLGKCVRVHFSEYQVLDKHGFVTDNVAVPKRNNKDCVVFRTYP